MTSCPGVSGAGAGFHSSSSASFRRSRAMVVVSVIFAWDVGRTAGLSHLPKALPLVAPAWLACSVDAAFGQHSAKGGHD
jgi:hypothetical protein